MRIKASIKQTFCQTRTTKSNIGD
uniref:Uncharacterized protein n=1 Tax=Rhizophora mucronata TaxID=61149 RepID=A0A2P2LJY5_RHIMU